MHGAMSIIVMILLMTLDHLYSSQMRMANNAPGPQPAVHGLLLCTGGSLALSVQRLLQLRLQRQAKFNYMCALPTRWQPSSDVSMWDLLMHEKLQCGALT